MTKKRYVIPKIIYESRNPNNTDDIIQNYVIGQPWLNISTKEYFINVNNDENNAQWVKVNLGNYTNEFRTGISNFLSNNFPRIINHGLSTTPQFVSIMPLEYSENDIGDIWAIMDEYTISVYNTGESKVSFCWFVAGEMFNQIEYEELIINFENLNRGKIYTEPYSGLIDTDTVITFPKNSNIKLYPIPDSNYAFGNWGGNIESIDDNVANIILDESKTINIMFVEKLYNLQINKIGGQYGGVISNPSGIACGHVCTSMFPLNTEIYLEYNIHETGYIFGGWEGCDEVTDDGKCKVILNRDRVVTCIFEPDLPKLIILKLGDGIVKTINSSNINCGDICYNYFDWNSFVNLEAIPNTGYQFIGWYGDIDSNNSTISLQINENKVVGALFELIKYTLSIDMQGIGKITSTDNNIDCPYKWQAIYEYGSTVELVATNMNDYVFKKWIYNGIESSENTLMVNITDDLNIIAIFELPKYSVMVNAGDNGSIYSVGDQDHGSNIIISAYPDPGYEVDKWSGCDDIINHKCYLYNIESNKNIDVTFREIPLNISHPVGYVCGGKDSKQISKFVFPFDSGTSVYINNLQSENMKSSANNSSLHSYVCGGKHNNQLYDTIQRFSFNNDNIPMHHSGNLNNASQYTLSNNSTQFGYVCSGNLNLKDITKFNFPLDIGKLSTYGELDYIYLGSGFNSTTYGYVTGSVSDSSYLIELINKNERFTFAFNTGNSELTLDLSNIYNCPSSCNSSKHGYISSGVKYDNIGYIEFSLFEQLDFSLNSGQCIEFSNLDNIKNMASSNNSTSYGYVCGGYNSDNIKRINFAIPSEDLNHENIKLHEIKHSMSATDGTIF